MVESKSADAMATATTLTENVKLRLNGQEVYAVSHAPVLQE